MIILCIQITLHSGAWIILCSFFHELQYPCTHHYVSHYGPLWMVLTGPAEETRGSFQYKKKRLSMWRYVHYKDKMSSWQSYLDDENHFIVNWHLYIAMTPVSWFNINVPYKNIDFHLGVSMVTRVSFLQSENSCNIFIFPSANVLP